MPIPANYSLELLKTRVLAAAGLKSVTPSDCKSISILINNKTNCWVSETTLKRIYGFALSKFLPSLFTLDVLAKFCDFNGWKDFDEHSEPTVYIEDNNWIALKQKAHKITNFTIDTLKNRSGIPYRQTIKRDFIYRHIDEFLKSGLTGTVISAPASYGKTIGLCHWVEDQLNSKTTDDILLFFSSTALMSVLFSGMDLNAWMQTLLGYGSLNSDNAMVKNQHIHSKFYLIIDGFDEHLIKEDQFDLVLNQITDFFSYYQSNNRFKLILTMRSSTWINYRHEMENGTNTWYTGFKTNDECTNVSLFSIGELRELSVKINPAAKSFRPGEVSESLKHPLYFQLYYKQHKKDFSLADFDQTSAFELNSLFILNKVYLGKYSTEKTLLIKSLVHLMEFDTEKYQVEKIKINDLIKEHQHAYKELVAAGILKETNESNYHRQSIIIGFVNNYFLAHSIAKTLLTRSGDSFGIALIQTINTLFAKSEHKLPVLKYSIIHAIKTGQQDSFEKLTEIDLTPNQKSELVIFLGDLLNKEFTSLHCNESFHQYFNQKFSKKLFDYFFGMELVTNGYKKTLNTLLKFELTNRKKILVYTSLALTSVINLELDELSVYLEKLRAFSSADYQSFAVNPLSCLDALYHYFKYGIIQKKALTALTKLLFNPPDDSYNVKDCASNDMLYLLGMYTLLIADNPKKVIRFIDVVKKAYKNDDLCRQTSQYDYFINILASDVYYKLNKKEKVLAIYNTLSARFERENMLTPFMKGVLHCLRVKVMLDTPKENAIPNEMKCIEAISAEWGSKINRLYTLALLQYRGDSIAGHLNFQKQMNYDYNKMVRNNGLNGETFIIHKSFIY